MEGKEIDPSRLEQGSDFVAEVRLTHPGIRDQYKEMALTQMFPSGWEIRNLRLDQMESSRVKDQPDYQDIRDDRVYSYFGLHKNESKTFVVLLNAAYLGDYFLPAVYCEAMYDRTIHATRAGKWVKVIRQK
jgi:alpha-2-macroglobulin